MFIRRLLAPLVALEDDAALAGGPAPEAAAPAPEPVAPVEPVAPAPDPTAMPDPADIAARVLSEREVGELAPDDMTYRDAKVLREEVTAVRQALAGVPENLRGAVVAFAPVLGSVVGDPAVAADVALVQAYYPSQIGRAHV
mgnify:CR=1 FL=1